MDLIKHETKGTLSVSGTGEVKAKPDIAVIQLGVVTSSKSARDAVAENADRMAQLVHRMKAAGVASEDLRTVGFTISPLTDSEEKSPTFGQVVSYRVENTVTISVDPQRAGAIIDEGVAAGANMGGDLSFGLRDESRERDQATAAAIKAAMHDAELAAKTMGVTLEGPTAVDVSSGGQPIFRPTMRFGRDAGTPIEAGVLTISARATMTFAIVSRR